MVALRLEWQTPPSVLVANLDAYRRRLIEGIHLLGDTFAQKMAAFAKANAPWNDQSGAARQGLTGLAVKAATGVVIYLFGTVLYQLFLERGTRFMAPRPIILPTLEAHYGEIMAALRALVGG